MPGVKEDVTEIILNIKGLTAKLHGEGPKTVYIEAEGECEVTAGDIKLILRLIYLIRECTSQHWVKMLSYIWK